MRRLFLIGPGFVIGAALATFVVLGFGGPIPRWVMFIWPALVIAESLIVMGQEHTAVQNRVTIALQARVIRKDSELLTHFLQSENDGRE